LRKTLSVKTRKIIRFIRWWRARYLQITNFGAIHGVYHNNTFTIPPATEGGEQSLPCVCFGTVYRDLSTTVYFSGVLFTISAVMIIPLPVEFITPLLGQKGCVFSTGILIYELHQKQVSPPGKKKTHNN